jgi:UTP--glucose-1-phosphate uridylyltransferase
MTEFSDRFKPFKERLFRDDLPEIFIKNFEHQYQKLLNGETGEIPESELDPITDLVDTDRLSPQLEKIGRDNFSRTVFLKLNGGLGTSMGLEKPKSLLPVKEDYSFLDIIALQSLSGGYRLLLMNSFSTQQDSLQYLKKYPQFEGVNPLDFLQHKSPKVRRSDFSPVEWPQNPQLEWSPPGHGDLYLALYSRGLLNQLINSGYEYAFISNADNLGAVLDPTILGHFIRNDFPFMMEVADRTEADKKGGHLAKRKDGRLIVREIAQCPEGDQQAFQNIQKHRYFNTNNLWLNLVRLGRVLQQNDYILDLPLIRNLKTVDPRDPNSTPVFQIETAAGSAVSIFEKSSAIRVPRTRFSPVKNTNDLLAVRSDLHTLSADFQINSVFQGDRGAPVIDLDSQYYKLIDEFEARFSQGPPSLKYCTGLKIRGDVKFGKNVSLQGNISIINNDKNQKLISQNTVLKNTIKIL